MTQFRDMRRKGQQLSNEESIAILENATAGTLALLGDDDYPYAVPISTSTDNPNNMSIWNTARLAT